MGRRIRIALCCSICKARNYETTKVRQEGVGPLELKKFCKTCNAHTMHVEGK
jgi:large subunit ribosomal protein L33